MWSATSTRSPVQQWSKLDTKMTSLPCDEFTASRAVSSGSHLKLWNSTRFNKFRVKVRPLISCVLLFGLFSLSLWRTKGMYWQNHRNPLRKTDRVFYIIRTNVSGIRRVWNNLPFSYVRTPAYTDNNQTTTKNVFLITVYRNCVLTSI